jgi:hypothetical protein
VTIRHRRAASLAVLALTLAPGGIAAAQVPQGLAPDPSPAATPKPDPAPAATPAPSATVHNAVRNSPVRGAARPAATAAAARATAGGATPASGTPARTATPSRGSSPRHAGPAPTATHRTVPARTLRRGATAALTRTRRALAALATFATPTASDPESAPDQVLHALAGGALLGLAAGGALTLRTARRRPR